MYLIELAIEIYFAFVLGISGLAKVDDYEHFVNVLHYQNLIPTKYVPFVARVFPLMEIAIAFLFISGIAPVFSAIIVLCLFAGFLLQKSILLALSRTEDCGCYGSAKPEPITTASIGTSALMALLAIFHLWLVFFTSPLGWQLRLGITTLFLCGGVYLVIMSIFRQKKAFLEEAERLKKVGSLEIGEQVHSFQAKDQNDNLIKLTDFIGRQLLLLFVLPGCPACSAALTDLPKILQERPDTAFLIVGGADSTANLDYAQKYNLQVSFIVDARDLAKLQYRIHAFPTAILLDEKGIVRNKSFASNIQLLRRVTSPVKLSFSK